MKLNVPKVLVDLPLREYAQECGDETLRVWQNPSHGVITERGEMLKQSLRLMTAKAESAPSDDEIAGLNQRWFAWLSVMVSQDDNPDSQHTAEEIAETYEAAPDFIGWLTTRVTRMVDDYAAREKKRPTTR